MNIKNLDMSSDNKSRFTQSVTKDGMTKSVTVKEVENGFLIRIEKYGKESEEGEYENECKEFISKTNPLAEKSTTDAEKTSDIMDGVKSLLSEMGEINL